MAREQVQALLESSSDTLLARRQAPCFFPLAPVVEQALVREGGDADGIPCFQLDTGSLNHVTFVHCQG